MVVDTSGTFELTGFDGCSSTEIVWYDASPIWGAQTNNSFTSINAVQAV